MQYNLPNYRALAQLPRLSQGGAGIFQGFKPPAIPAQFRLPQQDGSMGAMPDPYGGPANAFAPLGSSVVNAPAGMDMGASVPVTAGPSAPNAPRQSASALPRLRQSDPSMYAPNDARPGAPGVKAPDIAGDAGQAPFDGSFPKMPKADLPMGGEYDGNTNTSSWLGGLINYTPKEGQSDGDRLKLAGATLKDMAAGFAGGDGNALAGEEGAQDKRAQKARALDAMSRVQQALANANGSPEATRAALVQAALAGVDTGAVQSAMAYGKPSLKSFNRTDNVYAVGPDGLPAGVVQRGAVDPKIVGGMAYDPVSRTATAVPGYMGQQISIAQAKANARAAATAGASAGAMQMPQNPAYMFRRR